MRSQDDLAAEPQRPSSEAMLICKCGDDWSVRSFPRSSSKGCSGFRTHHNLIITPHIAGASIESIAGARIFMARKLATFLGGEMIQADSK